MFNTIILKHADFILTDKEHRNFAQGDGIGGENSNPAEVRRWSIDQKAEAQNELAKLRCKYEYDKGQNRWHIEEYALEYCECDEDGEFLDGSDFDFAEAI